MTHFLLAGGIMMLMGLAILTRPLWSSRSTKTHSAKRFQAQLANLSNDFSKGKISDDEFKQQQDELTRALTEGVEQDASDTPPVKSAATLALILGVPALAAALYFQIGKPEALDGVEPIAQATDQSMDMSQAIESLRARLEQAPDDAEGWALLGRSYMAVQQYQDANAAFERAVRLDQSDPNIQVALAESLIYVSGQATLPPRSEQLLQAALSADPDNQRALWLLGLGAYQAENWELAITYWDAVMLQLDPASGAGQQIQGLLSEARQKGGITQPVVPVVTQEPNAQSAGKPSLTVNVSIDPSLASRVTGSEVLFVFARAPSGPPMPLAIQRLSAADLPVTLSLNDSHAMVENMNLSSRADVVVGARISRSGNATPSAGDLQVFTRTVSTSSAEPIALVISEVVQ